MERAKAVFDKLSRFAALWKRRGAKPHRRPAGARRAGRAADMHGHAGRVPSSRGSGAGHRWLPAWPLPSASARDTAPHEDASVGRDESVGEGATEAGAGHAPGVGSGSGSGSGNHTLAHVPPVLPAPDPPPPLPSVDVPTPRRRPRPRNPFADEARRSREAHGIVPGMSGGALAGTGTGTFTPARPTSQALDVSSSRRRPRVPLLSPTPPASQPDPPAHQAWPFVSHAVRVPGESGTAGAATATPRTWGGDVSRATPVQAAALAHGALVTPSSVPPSARAARSGVSPDAYAGLQVSASGVDGPEPASVATKLHPHAAAARETATSVGAMPSAAVASVVQSAPRSPASPMLAVAALPAGPHPTSAASAPAVTPVTSDSMAPSSWPAARARGEASASGRSLPTQAAARHLECMEAAASTDARKPVRTHSRPRIDPARVPELVAQLEGFMRKWTAKKAVADKALLHVRDLEGTAQRFVATCAYVRVQ